MTSARRRPGPRGGDGVRAVLAGLVALALVIGAGCGGDDPSPSADGVEPSTAPTEPTTPTDPTLPGTTDPAGPSGPTEPARSGCEGAAPEPGTTTGTVEVDGTPRTYVLHVPASIEPGAPSPLVLTFHGLGASGAQQMAESRWDELADREGVVVVAPDAQGLFRGWDISSGPEVPGSDLAFVAALLDHLDAALCVDPDRRYANGISNGSALTFALACHPELGLAAYGGVAGAVGPDACPDAPPVSITYAHGTADPVVPLDAPSDRFSLLPPSREALEAWVSHGGCPEPPSIDRPAPSVERSVWEPCDAGTEIEAHLIDGGGHTWPGATHVEAAPELGATSGAIDATQVMWDFFAAHPAG